MLKVLDIRKDILRKMEHTFRGIIKLKQTVQTMITTQLGVITIHTQGTRVVELKTTLVGHTIMELDRM